MQIPSSFSQVLALLPTNYNELFWLVWGLAGQGLFFGRFLVQWISSERARRSIIPLAFWYFSVGGGTALFIYALHRKDPVFILGQGLGLVIYGRNLYIIYRERRENDARHLAQTQTGTIAPPEH